MQACVPRPLLVAIQKITPLLSQSRAYSKSMPKDGRGSSRGHLFSSPVSLPRMLASVVGFFSTSFNRTMSAWGE